MMGNSDSGGGRARTVSKRRLRRLLKAYGADPKRWPEAERAAASALLLRAPEMAAERQAMARLDQRLSGPRPLAPSEGLADRIKAEARGLAQERPRAAAAIMGPRPSVFDILRRLILPQAVALGAAALGGFFLASQAPAAPAQEEWEDQAATYLSEIVVAQEDWQL